MTFLSLLLRVEAICGLVINLFMIKRIPRSLNNFTRGKVCYVSLRKLYIWLLLSRSNETVPITINMGRIYSIGRDI